MAQQFQELSERHQSFIEEQNMFFVGTAAIDGRVNISPKGLDSLKVLGRNRVAWLNVTGSGNETAAHVIENPRMTLMFMSLAGAPMILRLYGTAKVVHRSDVEWSSLITEFPPIPGARQIFDLTVDLVQTSCGMAVPLYDYVANRTELTTWSAKSGEEKMRQYWLDRNAKSIDGKPTCIEKNA
jgi:Pyridoxamine 5'-phosphate oxidase